VDTNKLHAVVAVVRAELEEQQVLSLMASATSALQTSITEPTPERATAFETAHATLLEALDACASNTFPPSLLHILGAIGGTNNTGTGLAAEIEASLEAHGVTPAAAVQQLTAMRQRVADFSKTLTTLADAFETLAISSR